MAARINWFRRYRCVNGCSLIHSFSSKYTFLQEITFFIINDYLPYAVYSGVFITIGVALEKIISSLLFILKPRALAGFFVCGDGGRFVSHYEKTEIH